MEFSVGFGCKTVGSMDIFVRCMQRFMAQKQLNSYWTSPFFSEVGSKTMPQTVSASGHNNPQSTAIFCDFTLNIIWRNPFSGSTVSTTSIGDK